MSTSDSSINISYGDVPSRATLYDYARGQFVLLKARSGCISPGYVSVAQEVLSEVAYIESRINPHIANFDHLHYFKLRGIWFDDAYGNMTIHVDVLHDRSEKPLLTENQIQTALHHEGAEYGMGISVSVRTIPVNARSDHFFAIADEFYDERLKVDLFW